MAERDRLLPRQEALLTLRAEQQLALIYLREDDYDRAMAIFEKLAKPDDDERSCGRSAWPGKCGVLSLRSEYHESNAVFGQAAARSATN